MKKSITLFLAAIFGLVITANAQIQRGNILAGGDIAHFDLGLNKQSHFEVAIDPKLAFFIKDNVAIGGYVTLDVSRAQSITHTLYGVGALGRYYFADKNNVSPLRHSRGFLEGNLGIQGDNVSGGSSTNGLGLGVGPGFAYFITPNIGLETLLKYNIIAGFGNRATSSDLTLNVGFQIYLPSHGLKSKVMNDVK